MSIYSGIIFENSLGTVSSFTKIFGILKDFPDMTLCFEDMFCYLWIGYFNTCIASDCDYGAVHTYVNLFIPVNHVTNS